MLGHPRTLYEHAVLHIVVAVAHGQWRLLFAFVELLPREIPAPLHDGVIDGPTFNLTGKHSGVRVFADHVPASAEVALGWYEDARGGSVVRPERSGAVRRAAEPAR